MITLTAITNGVQFIFEDSKYYLYGTGTINVPINSLSLVLDNSGAATFRKAASNDIFVSAPLSEFGMTAEEIESFYTSNMVGSTGGGGDVTSGEVQTMINASISGKADSVSAVSSAEYVSSSTTINFKNIDGTVISSIDASDFVIDGMIEDVRIETLSGASYLVIDFNTESGKEDIQIPLTDIFDPSNYYNKQEVDNLVSAATDDMATQTWVGEQGYITGVDLSNYAEISAVTEEITAAVSGKVDTSIYTAYTAATDTALGNKLDSSAYTPVTIDQTLNSGSTNAVANSAITNVINEIEEVSAAAFNALNDELSGKQDTLIAGDNITISGNVISASGGGGGNNVIEVTQAEYDALVSAGTLDLTALYVITDAAAINVSGFVATSAITTAVTSASTNDEIPSALAVYAATSGGSGGGASYTAGTNISIDTANTISCTLPFSYEGDNLKTTVSGNSFVAYFNYGQIIGVNNTLQGKNNTLGKIESGSTIIGNGNQLVRNIDSFVIGSSNNLGNMFGANRQNYVFGYSNTLNPVVTNEDVIDNNFVIGNNNVINKKNNNFIFGYGIKPSNDDEFALGKYNNSVSASTTFGDSGNTLFSVGNGTADNARHNAFEIRQNGDIYITSGGTDIKLQDNLGGGDASSAVTSGDTNAVQGGAVFEQLGGLKFVSLTQTEYNNLQNKDANTLYIITSGQTCTPTSSAFTNVDENFNDFSSPVYELKFDFGGIQGSYESGSLQAYILLNTVSGSDQNAYEVSCEYDDMNDLTSIRIDFGGEGEGISYTAETAGSSITVDLCQVFGQGMYILEEFIPMIQTCLTTECTEYYDNYVMYVKL